MFIVSAIIPQSVSVERTAHLLSAGSYSSRGLRRCNGLRLLYVLERELGFGLLKTSTAAKASVERLK